MTTTTIVGAGPAGASAGYHLASRGHSVTLVDRAAFPRSKTCGDWIAQGALRALANMGLSRAELEQQAGDLGFVESTLVASPNGGSSVIRHDPGAYCIPRTVFDEILVRRAQAAGCRLVQADIRNLRAADDEHLAGADHVIDARGAAAGTTNCVALRAYWTAPQTALDDQLCTTAHIFTDRVFGRGYGWIFPVTSKGPEVQFNIGVGMWKPRHNRTGRLVTDYFERFVSSNEVAKSLREVATAQSRPRGHHLAIAQQHNRVAGNGILRIGDAANLTDPLTGEGIGHAIHSGELVANAIDQSSSRHEAEVRWQATYEAVFEKDFLAALRLQRLLRGSAAKNLATWLLRRSPRFELRFHRSLIGVEPYRGMFGWRRA